jgi:hypothetical protein
MMDLTININKDNNDIQIVKDNFAFATYNDGLIYQYVPYNMK